MSRTPTRGAKRAAQAIVNLATDKQVPYCDDMAVLIERETGVGGLLVALERALGMLMEGPVRTACAPYGGDLLAEEIKAALAKHRAQETP
jgi:hypothetical protein